MTQDSTAATKAHAALGASGAGMWMACPGSLAMGQGFKDTSSEYADEGTAAHEVAEMCLRQGQDAIAFAGRIITIEETGRKFEVNAEMVDGVQLYLDYVRALGGHMLVETEVDFSNWLEIASWTKRPIVDPRTGHPTGKMVEERAFGTSDAIVITDDEIVVIDFKYGRKAVDAVGNAQMSLYGLGALDVASLVADIDKVRLVIVQPRSDGGEKISEWSTTVEALEEFAGKARVAARQALQHLTGEVLPPILRPGEKQCQWCRGKTSCPAFNAETRGVVTTAAQVDDFEDLTEEKLHDGLAATEAPSLGQMMAKVEMLEMAAKAIRAETERRLVAGQEVPGFKLVEGKRGNRSWINADEAELRLKGMRLKTETMYDLKLISPTTAEKLAKAGDIGPRQWKALQAEIGQSAGKPSVAPEDDKRPAITVAATADDFAVIDDGSDLA